MITGFSYNTKTGEWLADYKYNNKLMFKCLYKNSLGYFIKIGKKEKYLTEQQVKDFKATRRKTRKQLQEV